MDNNLFDRLKIARKNVGLTQIEAAKKLGIAYPTLNKYEKGHRTPDSELLNQMAKLYDCDAGWLLSGEGGKESSFVAEEGPCYDALPEPVRKAVEVMLQNPDKAWEIYATILEKAGDKKGKE